jgi:hypothetical protein
MNAWRSVAGHLLPVLILAGVLTRADAAVAASTALAAPSDVAGEAAYLRGVLGSGAPLEGKRDTGTLRTSGMDAACVNCHQRSGLGYISKERLVSVPPITGRYLFQPRNMQATDHELTFVESVHTNRATYTDASLARAIREGIDSDGNPLGYMMPRFALNDADMASLIAYLKGLDPSEVPGVTPTVLHFATIITPDADPVKRRGMLDVLQRYFADKNTFPFPPSPRMRSSGKTIYSKSLYMANRHWALHVWELTGPAAGWKAQLARHMQEEPVLAVVSGLGGSNWAPVHEFCENQRLPCLFPNVEVPAFTDRDFYSLYFSRGVLLEAELIAKSIAEPDQGQPAKSVLQIYRANDNGEAATKVLAAALERHHISVRSRVLAAGEAGEGVPADLAGGAAVDALVLWLRPADIAALGRVPAEPVTVYMSGLMGGLEKTPLPPSWRGRTQLAYPFDLPDRRVVRVDYPLGWFSFRHIPVVAEQVQVDTYLACGVLAETLSHMADTFVPEYLVERMQEMLEHRILTGYYPRLALSERQRFASKGGYVVHFAGADGPGLVAAHDWTVP